MLMNGPGEADGKCFMYLLCFLCQWTWFSVALGHTVLHSEVGRVTKVSIVSVKLYLFTYL